MLNNQAIEDALGDGALLGIELADSLELELEGFVRAPVGVSKDQLIQAHAEGERDFAERIERGLRGAGLVALDLGEVQAEGIGQVLLGPAALFAPGAEAVAEVHRKPVWGDCRSHDANRWVCRGLRKVA